MTPTTNDDLRELARENDVDVNASDDKAALVAKLDAAKVDVPEDAREATSSEQSGDKALADAGIATPEQNAELEHSEGGRTTRDDPTDAGVPMLQGDGSEPVGPEDALGDGPKRGDYSQRIPGNPTTTVPTANGGDPVYAEDEDGNDVVVDYAPNARLEHQAPKASDQGEVAGEKGGVTTG